MQFSNRAVHEMSDQIKMNNISVIVPCYNVASVLSRCLDSLLAQTRPIDEIIIINDGSTDNTQDIAMSYSQKNKNIRVVAKQNEGLPQARKTGVLEAHGEYIGFVDSDDWVEPDMYEKLYNAISQTGSDVACCGLYKSFEDGTKKPESQLLADGTAIDSQQALHLLHCRRDVFPYMWNKLFRRKLFEGVQFPEGNFTGEDYVTTIQLLQAAKSTVVVNAPLYNYWQCSSSMSRGGFKPSHITSFHNYLAAEKSLLNSFPHMKEDISCYLIVEFMSFVIAMSRGNNYNQDLLKQIQDYVRTNIFAILKNNEVPILYRGSAAAFCIHHKILTAVYHLISH